LLIVFTLKIDAIRFSETSVLTGTTQRQVTGDDILHTHRCENLKSYIALTGCDLERRGNVSPVRYDQGFYIPEDGILHGQSRENLKSYIALTGWTL
jgi:hypothetical protein